MILIRFFSFQYNFFDIGANRTRYGVWNVASAEGFPAAKDLISDICYDLKIWELNFEPDSVCLTGWQEFQTENDYRHFTGVQDVDFYEMGKADRENLQDK